MAIQKFVGRDKKPIDLSGGASRNDSGVPLSEIERLIEEHDVKASSHVLIRDGLAGLSELLNQSELLSPEQLQSAVEKYRALVERMSALEQKVDGIHLVPGPVGPRGPAFIPDYANMETTNRITANNGTWTADRDGFVRCSLKSSDSRLKRFFVNGVEAFILPAQTDEGLVTIPVRRGDIVKLSVAGGFTSASCYFIPPFI